MRKRQESPREFVGMNPGQSIESELLFDSNFESGNLDMVYTPMQNVERGTVSPHVFTCGFLKKYFIVKTLKMSEKKSTPKNDMWIFNFLWV